MNLQGLDTGEAHQEKILEKYSTIFPLHLRRELKSRAVHKKRKIEILLNIKCLVNNNH